jgi:hypothetical protein
MSNHINFLEKGLSYIRVNIYIYIIDCTTFKWTISRYVGGTWQSLVLELNPSICNEVIAAAAAAAVVVVVVVVVVVTTTTTSFCMIGLRHLVATNYNHFILPPLIILVCTAKSTITSFTSYASIKRVWERGRLAAHGWRRTIRVMVPLIGGAATQNHPCVKSSCFNSRVRAMRWTSHHLCPPSSKGNIG